MRMAKARHRSPVTRSPEPGWDRMTRPRPGNRSAALSRNPAHVRSPKGTPASGRRDRALGSPERPQTQHAEGLPGAVGALAENTTSLANMPIVTGVIRARFKPSEDDR